MRNLNFPKPFQNLNQNLPNWRDTAQNILHNLHGQHEATYAQDCTYHLSLPLLILAPVLVTKGSVPEPCPPVHKFWNRPHLEPCAGNNALEPAPNPPGTCLKPPGTSPEPSRNPVPEHCWGKKHKPRCYPQQGNSASKENLRARLFPILGEVSWYFEIFAVTTSEIQGATTTSFTTWKPCAKLKFPETLPEPESEPSKLTGYCPKHSP